VIRNAKIENLRYRGQPIELDITFAMGQAGPVQIEFCEQHDDKPSAYRDVCPKGQEGFHHMCAVTNDYGGEIAYYAGMGCEPAMEGKFGEMRFCYMYTRAQIGFMTEIIEAWEPVLATHRRVAEAAQNWDGSGPIRNL
jgi:hypothetical protein